MNNKNIISPRGRDFLLHRRKKRYAELTEKSNCKNTRIKCLVDNKLIGRFSCLSVSDIANITSFYKGKAYYYVMNKDIDQLHIDLLYEKETKEPDGVEVKVPMPSWNMDCIDCLSFIKAVYVESEHYSDTYNVKDFNERKVYTYKHFKLLSQRSISSFNRKPQVLLGLIPYQVDLTTLWDYSDSWHKSWYDTFKYIYPTIEIGKLDITPNRENLLYSERTKEALRKAYDACIAEMQELWNTECAKEYEDILDYVDRVSSYVNNKITLHDLQITLSNKLVYKTSYKKYKEWDKITEETRRDLIKAVLNKELDVFGKLSGDTLHQGKRSLSWYSVYKLLRDWLKYDYRMVFALPSKAGFSGNYFKGFISETYGDDDKLFIRKLHKPTITYVRGQLFSIFTSYDLANSTNRRFIFQFLREFLKGLEKKIIVTDIIGSPEYAKYKKDNAIKKEKRVISTEVICFTVTVPNSQHQYKYNSSLLNIVPFIKDSYNNKYNIVYTDLDNPFLEAFNELRYPNLVILSAAKGKMKLLKEGLPDWVKPIESLYSPDNRVLQKFATMQHICSQSRVDLSFRTSRRYFSEYINNIIGDLRDYKEKYLYQRHNYAHCDANDLLKIVPEEKYNRLMLGKFNQVKKYLKLGYICDTYAIGDSFEFYVLMKNKKFRPSFEYYTELKDRVNRILNRI